MSRQPPIFFFFCLLSAGLVSLGGCSLPGLYKIDIQQGNAVTQDMVNQLKPGMNKQQVRFIMGTPLLVDTFHANRWDYLFSYQPGTSDQRVQEHISLVFNDDVLSGLAGDFLPGVSRDEALLGTSLPVVDESVIETIPADSDKLIQETVVETVSPPSTTSPSQTLMNIQREVDAPDTSAPPSVTPIEEVKPDPLTPKPVIPKGVEVYEPPVLP